LKIQAAVIEINLQQQQLFNILLVPETFLTFFYFKSFTLKQHFSILRFFFFPTICFLLYIPDNEHKTNTN